MSSRGEAALVKAAQQGDGRARQELVAAYLPLVYNIVGRALDGHADVDDVVQETMIRALGGLGSLRDPEGFRSWLVAIAMNRVRSHRQDHRAAPAAGSLHEAYDVPDPGADFVGLTILRLGLSGQRREVAEAARWLDPEDRDLLSLWWLEAAGRLTRAEVAAAMELTPQHTAVRVQRMKERLEAARVVVRALSAVPRCVLLDDLVTSWDGAPSALWRKRLARHTRDCTVCGGLGAGLAPAEGLLVGLALVPLGAGLAAVPPREYVALAADARAAGGYGESGAYGEGGVYGEAGDQAVTTAYGEAGDPAATATYGEAGHPTATTPYGDPLTAPQGTPAGPPPAPDGGRLQQRQERRRTRRRRVAVAAVAALVAGGGTAALLLPGDGDDTRRPPAALETPGADTAMSAPEPARTSPTASPSASPSPSPTRSASPSPSTKAPTRKARPTPTPTPTPSRTTARPTPPPAAPEPQAPAGTFAAQVLELVNAERAKAGCSPVRQNSTLDVAAQRHSDDMAARGFFDHTNPDGEDPGDRITAAGYRWSTYAENIARGQQTAAEVMQSWMNSPGHRANILNCSVKETGLGVHEGAGGPWWTQVFGSSL
ncbi:sigma-70 family RNA polymerase sigma factor [Streptomyces sp. enrichment culture]|uniref:sigma-70 family RNA polymerase sigma factor n=1 Tax=Streptomyces sp. enrichment culture TaxID=1795815 RepID=UPI003F56E6EC